MKLTSCLAALLASLIAFSAHAQIMVKPGTGPGANAAPQSFFVVAGPTYMANPQEPSTEGGGGRDENYTEAHAFFHQQMGNCSPTEIKFVYLNGGWELAMNFATGGPGNSATFEADYEYPAGTPHRITFNGGNNTATVGNANFLISDVVTTNIPPALAHFFTMTRVQVASHNGWFRAQAPIWTDGNISEGVTEDSAKFDQVMTPGPPKEQAGGSSPVSGASAAPGLGPIAILGNVSDCHSVLLWGDSYVTGTDDYLECSGSPLYQCGIFARGLHDARNNLVPYIRASKGGVRSSDWASGAALDLALLPYVKNMMAGVWGNDINGSRSPVYTAAQSESNITRIATAAALAGVQFFPATPPPFTASSDQFETLKKQSKDNRFSSSGPAGQLVAWLLGGGASPAANVIDGELGNPVPIKGMAAPSDRFLWVVTGAPYYSTGPSRFDASLGGVHPNGQGYGLGASDITANHISQLR
jgi:hypothetical protein